ncbi:MAG: hypothetical protein ACXACP_02165 [Candidatus Hodarchaeales archaeon]|jgi:hypothetical protein
MEKMQKYQSAPIKIPELMDRHESFVKAAAVNSGIATEYWLELKQYPPGSARSLWLFVDKAWRHLDNPNYSQESLVQEVFCNCPERLEVKVWYSGSVIVGLVVNSK